MTITMKRLSVFLFFLIGLCSWAQTGEISGVILDKEYDNQPLPFADVYIKGTTKGASTDFDGKFVIPNVSVGTKTIVISFVGYESKELQVIVQPGQTTVINESLSAGETLDAVVVEAAPVVKESEAALLKEQKKSDVIKESIGAEQLAKTGVTDASGATQKIAGVTKSEGSTQVYIRGLGDRYLTTTLNGLPVPSDDVENKNLNLNLFNSSVIQNVSVSKTFSSYSYADQASGNINVNTKEYRKDFFKVGLSYGLNTNIFLPSSFRVSNNNTDNTLGFFNSNDAKSTINNGRWNADKQNALGNFSLLLGGGTKFNLFGNYVKLTASINHRRNTLYREGQFREFQNNSFKRDFDDVELFRVSNNTTALIDLGYKINPSNSFSVNTLFINKSDDDLYEQGRNARGRVLDQSDETNDFGAFARDQNIKQTLISVTQLHGNHSLTANNKLTWGLGYNFVDAQEPNRIRNEVNIVERGIEILSDSGFEQRKSSQTIEDVEYNFYINDNIKLANLDEDGKFKINFGANFRSKSRDFESQFFGLQKINAGRIFTPLLDDLEAVLTPDSIGQSFNIINQLPNTYQGQLDVYAGFASVSFGTEKITGNVGFRYELDNIDLTWDVNNFLGRIGGTSRRYENYLPSFNLKYEINEQHFLRLASSVTTTLPEFKEIAPFVYISPSGRGTTGNVDLEKSDNYNIDLKWEFFPTTGQVVSVAAFYKQINNPINKTLTKGSTGFFTYANTGDKAEVLGLEIEGKIDLIDTDAFTLNTSANMTLMSTNQDLSEDFQYNGVTESDLEGASDIIFNSALTFSTKKDMPFVSTVATNYSSDKIAVLGASDNAVSASTNLFNNEIIEKGFWTLDFVASKEILKNLKLRLTARNLLNPFINQRQRIVTNFSGPNGDDRLVSSYRKGRVFSLSLSYIF